MSKIQFEDPTQEWVRDLFTYINGRLHWKRHTKFRSLDGMPAGSLNTWGYLSFVIDRRRYSHSRLVYIYHFGPLGRDLYVDHINNNPADDRIENLRPATAQQNIWNRRRASTANNRYRGVRYDSTHTTKPWRVSLKTPTESIYVGRFATDGEAAFAYDAHVLKTRGIYAQLNFEYEVI